jgi:hypothetical protein
VPVYQSACHHITEDEVFISTAVTTSHLARFPFCLCCCSSSSYYVFGNSCQHCDIFPLCFVASKAQGLGFLNYFEERLERVVYINPLKTKPICFI